MKHLLIIKTGETFPDISAHFGDFEDWIISGTALPENCFTVVSPFLSQPLPNATEISGVIITGSHAMVSDAEPWSITTKNWLKNIATTRIPILGICYGHQLIAETFGGKVDFHPAGREIGTVQITATTAAETDPLFRELPKTLAVHVAHAQTVKTLPKRAKLLARNVFEPHHAFVIDNHIWGVQFHPEFTEKITAAYIYELATTLKKEGLDPEWLISTLSPSQYGDHLLKKFYKICQQNETNKTPNMGYSVAEPRLL